MAWQIKIRQHVGGGRFMETREVLATRAEAESRADELREDEQLEVSVKKF